MNLWKIIGGGIGIFILLVMEESVKDHWQIIMVFLIAGLIVTGDSIIDALKDGRERIHNYFDDKLDKKLDDIERGISNIGIDWDIGLKEGEHDNNPYSDENDPSIHRVLLNIRDELRNISESLNEIKNK